jgi:hypothetical protein
MMSMISAERSSSDKGCELAINDTLLSLFWDNSDGHWDEAAIRAEGSKSEGDIMEWMKGGGGC